MNELMTLTASSSPAPNAVASALTTIATNITNTISAVAPVAIGIVGVFLVWKFGIRFFKSEIGRAHV